MPEIQTFSDMIGTLIGISIVIIAVALGILVSRTNTTQYDKIDGVLCVKHGKNGEWLPLREHMEKDHQKEYEELEKCSQ